MLWFYLHKISRCAKCTETESKSETLSDRGREVINNRQMSIFLGLLKFCYRIDVSKTLRL